MLAFFSQTIQPVDFRPFTASVNIEAVFYILLAAAVRLKAAPAVNKQTGNLIVLLIYGHCALGINLCSNMQTHSGTKFPVSNEWK